MIMFHFNLRFIWLIVVAIILLNFHPSLCDNPSTTTEGPDESSSVKRLRQELLITRQYDRMSRPVKNHLTQTKIDMRITINEFVDFDTVNSMLVTDAWFHISWRDEMLSWDPNEYQGVKQIHLSSNEIWKPDIVLINTAYQDNLLNIFTESDAIVNSTGDITWITMSLLRSKCPIWAYDYPFTIKPVNCRLTFCSLIYESHEVNLTTPGNEFFLAGPWFVNPRIQLINISGERYERHYEGYGMYSFESLSIQFKRRDNALPTIIKIPTLASIVFILCMFFIPVTWSVRVYLAMVAILIQLILILYIGIQLGTNAIGLARPISYLRDDLFLSSMALVLTLVFRRMMVLTDMLPQLPYVVSAFFSGKVARLLCFGINQNEYTTKQPVNSTRQTNTSSFGPSSAKRATNVSILPTSIQPRNNLGDHVSLVNEDEQDDREQDSAISGLGGSVSSLSTKNDQNNAYASNQIVFLTDSHGFEWMTLIIFFDRLTFIVYALIMVPRLM